MEGQSLKDYLGYFRGFFRYKIFFKNKTFDISHSLTKSIKQLSVYSEKFYNILLVLHYSNFVGMIRIRYYGLVNQNIRIYFFTYYETGEMQVLV